MKVTPALKLIAEQYHKDKQLGMALIAGEIARLLPPETSISDKQFSKCALLLDMEANLDAKQRPRHFVIAEMTTLINGLYIASLLEGKRRPKRRKRQAEIVYGDDGN